MIVKILMIDDHPGMIEGYKAMLSLKKERVIDCDARLLDLSE